MLDPLGLVLKAGVWYLVAAHDGQLRTYRISRARAVRSLPEHARRPTGFDLAGYWSESITAYERETPRVDVTLRVRRDAGRWLEDVLDAPALAAAEELPDPEPDAWRRLRLRLDWPARGRGAPARAGRGRSRCWSRPSCARSSPAGAETLARYREPARPGLATVLRLRVSRLEAAAGRTG